jgi:predicted glutamine amidotransferase
MHGASKEHDGIMCRFLAYFGEPVFMEDVVIKPCHSLVHQSLHAQEAVTGTNGDGFGLGWYSERAIPGLYRELRPAWSDENLRSICAQVKSHAFFAHVRASTGTATTRANCHPFVHQRHMFMHNGQIGNYGGMRRKIENLIDDTHYDSRGGQTDSEAIFLIAIGRGLGSDPIGALASVLADIRAMMTRCGNEEPLRFAAALTDGDLLYAFRWSCDEKAPTLYWRQSEGATTVVSEPIDAKRSDWQALPQGSVLVANRKGQATIEPFMVRPLAA